MKLRSSLPVLLLLLAALPAPATAQECDILSSGQMNTLNPGTPQQVIFVTVPVISCPGGRRISADNAYVSQASGVVQLMGNVQFQDSARTLTSTNAQYYSHNQRMSASGSVVLVHRTTNSIIRSEQLEYLEATPQRESLVQAMGGRPRAVLREAGATDSTTLDALQIDIIGEERLRGTGDATLTRDSLQAIGYVVEYVQSTGRLDVSGGRTRIEVPGYQLVGDSITATIGEGDQIRDVFARHTASLEAEEMDVTAAAIRLFFEDGSVSRMVAMQWEPLPGATAAGQARVVNEQFTMVADSLDVLAPQQLLQEAVAIGQAHVERVTPPELRGLLPEADEAVMRVIANDWMRGDTVRAFFTAAPDEVVGAAADTAAVPAAPAAAPGGERVLERLYAAGEPAQAMHRMRQEDAADDALLTIAYLVGRHVEVTFSDGLVAVVSASEDVRGVYLQPREAARQLGATGGTAATPPPGRRP